MRLLAQAIATIILAAVLAASSAADEPPVRYMPQVSGHIEDLRLGPRGELAVTFSRYGATRVWDKGHLRYVLPGHVAAVSGDGRRIATGTEFQKLSGKVRVYSVTDGRRLFEWDAGPIRVIAFSPDDRLVVSGGWDGRVHLWDLASGELLQRWEVDRQWMTSVSVSPNLDFVAASGAHGAWVWDVETGTERFSLDPHEAWVRGSFISADGSRVVTGSQDKTVRVYDARTGERLSVLHNGSDLWTLALSPDGRKIVTGGPGSLQIWDTATGAREHSIEVKEARNLAISPDSRTVAVGTSEKTAPVFDLETGERSAEFSSGAFASRVHFSGDGRLLAVGNASFRIYDVASGSRVVQVGTCGPSSRSLEFSSDGRFLLAGYGRGGGALWDLTGAEEPLRFDGGLAKWTGHEALFLAGGSCCSGRFGLWDAATGRWVATLEDQLPTVFAGSSPDGSTLATVSEAGHVRIWSGSSGELRSELPFPAASLASSKSLPLSAPSPRSLHVVAPDVVAVGYWQGQVAVWKDGRPEPWRTLEHQRAPSIKFLKSSADGRTLVSADTNEKKVHIWDLADGSHRTLSGPHGTVLNDVAMTADGSKLYAAWSRPDLDVWNLAEETEQELSTGPGGATALAVSANGRWIASGNSSGEVRFWQDDEEPRIFRVQSPPVSRVAIDPLGRWLAAADSDGTAILWDLSSGDELVRLSALPERGWAVTTPDGRWDAAKQGDVGGIVAWDRGVAKSLADVPQHRTPGLLRELMAPGRQPAREAKTESGLAGRREKP